MVASLLAAPIARSDPDTLPPGAPLASPGGQAASLAGVACQAFVQTRSLDAGHTNGAVRVEGLSACAGGAVSVQMVLALYQEGVEVASHSCDAGEVSCFFDPAFEFVSTDGALTQLKGEVSVNGTIRREPYTAAQCDAPFVCVTPPMGAATAPTESWSCATNCGGRFTVVSYHRVFLPEFAGFTWYVHSAKGNECPKTVIESALDLVLDRFNCKIWTDLDPVIVT